MKKLALLLMLLMTFPVPVCGGETYEDRNAGKMSVKVILYHNITSSDGDDSNPYAVPVSDFEKQMKWLQSNGYECITVSEMFQRLSGGFSGGKFAVITFDDGYPDVYTLAFPVLKSLGFSATTYLVAEKIDAPKNLTKDMIQDLYRAGWEIGSHSMTHAVLNDQADLDQEICGSRNLISFLTDIPAEEIRSFAYPYGNADETVTAKVRKCGYQSGAGLGQIPVTSSQNPYYFSRHPVTYGMTMDDFTALFTSGDKE